MQIYEIQTNTKKQEQTVHGTMAFPCASYNESFSEFICHEVPWHWHEEIEVVVVYQGSTLVECCEQQYLVGVGDGIIINANMLHRLTWHSKEDCKIINFVFHPSFIGGAEHSLIYRQYVLPIITSGSFTALPLSPAVGWQNSAIQAMQKAFVACEQNIFGCEMLVQAGLLAMWQSIVASGNITGAPASLHPLSQTRMKHMLAYIVQNYSEEISVAQLADAANISESECYRCFQTCLALSPMNYLLQFRMQQAAKLLLQEDYLVTRICMEVGFANASYFTKQFRKIYRCSPTEFRRGK